MNNENYGKITVIDRIKGFWTRFIGRVFGKKKEEPIKFGQDWRDVRHINLLSVFVTKLNNLVNTEATFDVESDSAQSEAVKELCAELEAKRYEVTSSMLADGDYFVFPAVVDGGAVIHDYLPQSRVRIVECKNDEVTDAFALVDWREVNGSVQYLIRRHILDESGTLTVSFQAVDSSGNPVPPAEWEKYTESMTVFAGANHIGFGRYKSPQDSRGLVQNYGVPLNFGCQDIEARIFHDLQMIEDEFTNGKSVIFTDPRNLLKRKDVVGYEIAENVIPVKRMAGDTGGQIDIFSPALRYSSFSEKLEADMEMMEKAVGTSKGILTDNSAVAAATATAVKRANADTIALIEKIRKAIDDGNVMTLEADALFLGVARDLWSYRSDWYDPFEDPAEQFNRLNIAITNGFAEKEDGVRWLFPNLSEEDLAEKMERINAGMAVPAGAGDEALRSLIGGA